DPTGTLHTISDEHSAYLFAKDTDGLWWLAHPYPKTGYTILERTATTIGGQAVDRIEARYEIDLSRYARADLVLQKITYVCRSHACTDVVYACTRTHDGRAIETFIGHVEADGGTFKATGDRSQAGQMCR